MKAVRDVYGIEERPPMLRLNGITEEERRLTTESYWRRSDTQGWLTQEQINETNARILELRQALDRHFARMINGNHRTAAMDTVAESILQLKPELIEMAREGFGNTVEYKQYLAKFLRMVASCTYRCMVFSHETPEHILAQFAANPKQALHLEQSRAEGLWMMATRFLAVMDSVKRQRVGLSRPELFNHTRNLLLEETGDAEVVKISLTTQASLAAAAQAADPAPDDTQPPEDEGSEGETGGKKKKKKKAASNTKKKRKAKDKAEREAGHLSSSGQGTEVFERVGALAPLLECVIATRACWFPWGHLMNDSYGTNLMKVTGAALAVNMWLDMETLLCLTNASEYGRLTACEEYLRNKPILHDGRIEAVPFWNSIQQQPSATPPLLGLWNMEMSAAFGEIWTQYFAIFKKAEQEDPLGPWWDDEPVHCLRQVFTQFGSLPILTEGDEHHRMFGVMCR
ncbi:hypothetical protein FRC07_014462, partial [Ceratobasidium sp. 392]